eukprot:2738342-Amphidinium_carterae.1
MFLNLNCKYCGSDGNHVRRNCEGGFDCFLWGVVGCDRARHCLRTIHTTGREPRQALLQEGPTSYPSSEC